jgi:hypothetical protein
MKMRGRVFLTAPAAIIRVNAHTTTGSHDLVTITDRLGIFFFFSLARFFDRASFPFSGLALFVGKQTVDLGSSRSRA